MKAARLLVMSALVVSLAGCGSGDDGEPKRSAEPTSATTSATPPVPTLDKRKVEQGIRRKFLKVYAPAHPGDSLTNVTCPDDISANIGDETTCDVDFSDGSYGRMTLKVVDEDGNFDLVDASKS